MLETSQHEHVPVLSGDIYCAPWCGCGCTKAAYDRAVTEAAALVERLGEGWEPRVWENAGWHYEAVKGVARVIPTQRGGSTYANWSISGYMVMFDSVWQFVAHGKTPEDALGFALQDARTAERRIAADCATLSDGEGK